jgi:hypothetical protein
MTTKTIVAFTAAAAIASAPAVASCLLDPLPTTLGLDGAEVPSNAELRALRGGDEITFTLPDGNTVSAPIVDDALGKIVELPDSLRPLPVGQWQYEAEWDGGTFTVLPVVDDEVPAAPVVSAARYGGGLALPFGECPGAGGRTMTSFSVDDTHAGDLVVINGGFWRASEGSTTLDLEMGGSSFQVSVRDAAGNQSEPTTVDVTGGSGCANLEPSLVGGVALVALGLRRRRRR